VVHAFFVRRPMPNEIVLQTSSMILRMLARTSFASASVKTALLPHPMSYPTPDGLTLPLYATTPPIGTAYPL